MQNKYMQLRQYSKSHEMGMDTFLPLAIALCKKISTLLNFRT